MRYMVMVHYANGAFSEVNNLAVTAASHSEYVSVISSSNRWECRKMFLLNEVMPQKSTVALKTVLSIEVWNNNCYNR